MEIWKQLSNTHDISSHGRVRSWINNKRNRRESAKILKTILRKDGYIDVSIFRKNYLVHRLVAIAFLDNPNNLPEVDHIDDNKANTMLSNLRWISKSNNMKKTYKVGTNKNTWVPNGELKMDDLDVITLQMFFPYAKTSEWADIFGVTSHAIKYALTRRVPCLRKKAKLRL